MFEERDGFKDSKARISRARYAKHQFLLTLYIDSIHYTMQLLNVLYMNYLYLWYYPALCARNINCKRIVTTKISSTRPVYSRIQRGDMFRLSQRHPQAVHWLLTSDVLQCSLKWDPMRFYNLCYSNDENYIYILWEKYILRSMMVHDVTVRGLWLCYAGNIFHTYFTLLMSFHDCFVRYVFL
jgi:hypothetical protein